MVFILRSFKLLIASAILLELSGCNNSTNYFTEKPTETTENITTEQESFEEDKTVRESVLPDSVFKYDVRDTILVPKE